MSELDSHKFYGKLILNNHQDLKNWCSKQNLDFNAETTPVTQMIFIGNTLVCTVEIESNRVVYYKNSKYYQEFFDYIRMLNRSKKIDFIVDNESE